MPSHFSSNDSSSNSTITEPSAQMAGLHPVNKFIMRESEMNRNPDKQLLVGRWNNNPATVGSQGWGKTIP